MRPLEVVIIDDEPIAIRRLRALIAGIPGVEVTASATNARDALEMLQICRPDLVLMDIEMPELSGMKLAAQLRLADDPPAIVFVTAFTRFAVEAFALDACDYLLKPVEPARLAETIGRVRAARDATFSADRVAELELLLQQLRAAEPGPAAPDSAIWLPDGHAAERVKVTDIRKVEAERDYVRIYTAHRSYFMRGRLGSLAARLGPSGMVRVHRSILVRASCVKRIEASGSRGYRLLLDDGTWVEASRRFKSEVKAICNSPA